MPWRCASSMFARFIFTIVDFGARKDLTRHLRARRTPTVKLLQSSEPARPACAAKPYHGFVLAFVEVQRRTRPEATAATSAQMRSSALPKTVNWGKRAATSRAGRGSFFAPAIWKARSARFAVLAIETRPSAKPCVRVHEAAFKADRNGVLISIPVRKRQRHSHS